MEELGNNFKFSEIRSLLSNRKNLISLALFLLLLISIPLSLYLVQKTQIFAPKATGIKDSKDPKIGATKVITLVTNNYTGTKYFLTPSADTRENSILQSIQSGIPQLEHKGYIIELQSNSIIGHTKEKKGVLTAETQGQEEINYRKQLENEHVLAKEDILLKLASNTEIKGVTLQKEIKITREFFSVFNGLAIEASPEQLDAIKSSKYIKKISPNLIFKSFLSDSVGLIGAPTVWAMDDSSGGKITGKGIKIGIIDTGVDYKHPDLGGCFGEGCKVVSGYDFVNNDIDPMDDVGHGTHVAAIAAGNGSMKGVAPEANLVAYKVLGSSGSGSGDNIIAALDRSVDPNQDGKSDDHLDVVNLSLGANCFGVYSSNCGPSDPISQAVNVAVWRGIVVVAAAGNSGSGEGTIGSPAVASQVIAVGASSKSDQIAEFSSRGPVIVNISSKFWSYIKPDVVAPGVNICAAKASALTTVSTCGDSNHVPFNGTSMATPHVAGAVALIKQVYPSLPSTSYKNILKSSASLISSNPLWAGGGKIDLPQAINQAKGNPPLVDLDSIAVDGATRNILGLIQSQNLKNWNLSYGLIDDVTNSWTNIQESTTIPQPYLQYSLDTKNMPNGTFKVRLQSEDNDGRKSREYGYLKVVKYKIKAPQNSDIYRVGDQVVTNIEFEEGIVPNNIKIEYKKIGGSYSQVYNGTEKIFTWDTTGLDTGSYVLKFTVNLDGIINSEEVSLYLDSTFKAGWPKNINYEINPLENRYAWVGNLETSVDDLDGDGTSEIIFQTVGFPPKLWVYNNDGTVRWSKEIRATDSNNFSNLNMVLVTDLNNDGKKEILLQNFMFKNTEIQAYDYQGNSVSGWPIKIESFRTRLIAADLNNDGSKEIIARVFGFEDKLIILSASGQIIKQWSLPRDNLSSEIESSPTVGNFDDDPDLEIVVATPSTRASEFPNGFGNEGLLYVYNMDGTVVSGWPATFPGLVEASPVVGDINKDGYEEIVLAISYTSEVFPDLAYGGVYAYNKSGQLLSGWPQGKGYNYWSTPALGDLDKDGYLEVVVSRLGEKTEVYKYNGSMFRGWPQDTHSEPVFYGNNWYSDIVSDISGDGNLDIISRAGLRMFAWDKQGEPIAGFPKVIQPGNNPPTIKDIDNDGKLEIVSSSSSDIDLVKLKSKARGAIYIWEVPNSFSPDLISWPTFNQNELRTGRYPLTPIVMKIEIVEQKYIGGPKREVSLRWNSISGMTKYNIYARLAQENNFGSALLSTEGNTGTIGVNTDFDYSLKVEGCDNLGKCVSSQIFLPKMVVATPTPAPAKRVFITSTTYNGNLGGLSGADGKCQTRASVAKLGGTWKAWLSDSKNSAANRLLHSSGSYNLLNGTVIASDWADLVDGSLQNSINMSEFGKIVSSRVWTGTQTDGSAVGPSSNYTCTDWRSSARGSSLMGDTTTKDRNWTATKTNGCSSKLALYCFEQ